MGIPRGSLVSFLCFYQGQNDDDDDTDTKHDWVATSAELVESGSDGADNEDVLMLEDHLDNMFNYEVDQV